MMTAPFFILCSTFFVMGCSTLRGQLAFSTQKDVVYKSVDGVDLKGKLFLPAMQGLKPAVVVVHGGGWKNKAGDMESICKFLAKEGYVVFRPDYRLAPKNKYPDAVTDIQDAIGWLRSNANQYEIDARKISGWGYSAGAHLILLAGLDPEANLVAIVAGGTPADLTVWPEASLVKGFLGQNFQENPELWRQASPINHVNSQSPPVFLYHGEWDKIVEVGQMDKMQKALQQKHVPTETYRVPWMGHIAVYFFSQKSIDSGVEFINRHCVKL